MEAGVKARRATARRAGLTALVTASLVTAGCTAGQQAQTADEVETLDGTTLRIGDTMTLGGLAIETPTSGPSWASGASVPVKVVIVNDSARDERLTSITSSSIGGWGTYPSAAAASAATGSGSSSTPSPVTIPAHSSVQFGTEHAPGTKPNQALVLTGTKTTLYPGSSIELTFTFARAGSVSGQVPVQLSNNPHSSIVPGPSATGQGG